jgi:Asp/Glu/hydantoin racemase
VPRIGLLIPTSGYSQEYLDFRVSLAKARVPDDVEFHVAVPPEAPAFLDEGDDFPRAIGAAGSFVAGLADLGLDVVVASGAIDPGLEKVREALPLPVVGPGEAAMYAASVVGTPLCLVTVDEHAVTNSEIFLKKVDAKPEITSIRSIDFPVRQCMQDLDKARDGVRRECRAAVDQDGAKQIYLGCMVFGTLGITDELRETLGVPVWDPFAVSIDLAYQIAMQSPRRA